MNGSHLFIQCYGIIEIVASSHWNTKEVWNKWKFDCSEWCSFEGRSFLLALKSDILMNIKTILLWLIPLKIRFSAVPGNGLNSEHSMTNIFQLANWSYHRRSLDLNSFEAIILICEIYFFTLELDFFNFSALHEFYRDNESNVHDESFTSTWINHCCFDLEKPKKLYDSTSNQWIFSRFDHFIL